MSMLTERGRDLKVTDVFTIAEYEKALEKMNSRGALKIAVKPN